MTAMAYGDVPLLDPDTGRFPDSFAPPSVGTDAAAAQTAKIAAETARDLATGSAPTLVTIGNTSGTLNLSSLTNGGVARVTLTGNITAVTLPAPGSSRSITITLILAQDATGSRTIVIPNAYSAWGVAPALTPDANAIDIWHLFWTGVGWVVMPAAPMVSIPTGWVV